MKGIHQKLKQHAVYVSSDCMAEKKPRGQYEIKFLGCLPAGTPGSYSLWLEDQQWLFNLCGCNHNLWTVRLEAPEAVALVPVSLGTHSQCELCSASQPTNRCYPIPVIVSSTLRISPDASAGTVCKHLSLGSFPYWTLAFSTSYLRWILVLVCISRGEAGSSSQLVFTLCALCVDIRTRGCIWRTGLPKAS